jgi:hypothetical protein
MRVQNKSNLWVGIALLVIPNWFSAFQSIYKELIQLCGVTLIVFAFIKIKKKGPKKKDVV